MDRIVVADDHPLFRAALRSAVDKAAPGVRLAPLPPQSLRQAQHQGQHGRNRCQARPLPFTNAEEPRQPLAAQVQSHQGGGIEQGAPPVDVRSARRAGGLHQLSGSIVLVSPLALRVSQ